MPELLEWLDGIPVNNQTVLIAAAAIAVVAFLIQLTLRALWARGSARRMQRPAPDDAIHVLPPTALFSTRRAPTSWTGRMDDAFARMVLRSGLNLAPDQAVAWMALTGVTGALGFFVWKPEWWMALAGFASGGGVVLAAFLFYQSRYRRRLQAELPDLVFMLARSTRAGLSLEQALDLAGTQAGPTIAGECRRCSAQIELGLAVATALQKAAARVQLLDFNALVSTIALYQQSGGNLPTLLDRLAGATRDHNQFRSYLFSATAMGRLTAVTIAAATPLILVAYLVLQPEYSTAFFHSSTGWTTIAVALGMEVIGGAWLYRLLSVNY